MDIIEALTTAGIEYRPGRSDDEIWLNCCFCSENGETMDTRFRLGVNLLDGRASCFNCGWKSRGVYTFRRLQEALSTGEMEASQAKRHEKKKEKVYLPEDFERLVEPNGNTDHWAKVAWRYLRRRGVTPQQIKLKHIGYSLVGDLAYRVVFPVYVHKHLKGLVGRDFTDKQEIKYRNSVGGKALYNFDKQNKTVVLLEGVFDTLKVEQAARKLDIDACGLLGHDLTDDQLELLEPYKRIVLWLDPDAAGLKGLFSIAKKLPKDKIVKVVLPRGFLHPGASDQDPSELETEVIVKRLLHAHRLTDDLQLKLRAWSAFDEE